MARNWRLIGLDLNSSELAPKAQDAVDERVRAVLQQEGGGGGGGGGGGPTIKWGTGRPPSNLQAPPDSLYIDTSDPDNLHLWRME